MAAVSTTADPAFPPVAGAAEGEPFGVPPASPWLRRLDRWSERLGDRLNPILVKETRQSLKSRQFVVTFSFLLVAALGWTVAGSLSMMPQIYTSPSAPRLLIGYYLLLALPMMLIVPLAAYRSLEAEMDDGTLELLSITALSPWQIVLGKLGSASLQMLVYLVTLFPCVAYAYTLRGIDLPTLGWIMAILIIAAMTSTVFALGFAPMARGRGGRIATLLVVIAALLLVQYMVGALVILTILQGNPLPLEWTGFLLIFSTAVSVCFCHLMLTVTAAQLTPESENRSTPIRRSLFMLTAVLIGLTAFAIEWTAGTREEALAVFFPCLLFLAVLWTLAGAMLASESAVITPRIQRELPATFLGRALLTFLTPGPATGLVFASLTAIVLASLVAMAGERMDQLGILGGGPRGATVLRDLAWVTCCYLIVFWNLVRWLVAAIRLNSTPRVEVGIVVLTMIAVVTALAPYSLELHANDYRPYSYSIWQVTNWAWTLAEAGNGLPGGVIELLTLAAVVAFLFSLATVGRRVLPLRIATPQAVLEAQAGNSGGTTIPPVTPAAAQPAESGDRDEPKAAAGGRQ